VRLTVCVVWVCDSLFDDESITWADKQTSLDAKFNTVTCGMLCIPVFIKIGVDKSPVGVIQVRRWQLTASLSCRFHLADWNLAVCVKLTLLCCCS
jgi:hypothetical protein